MSSAYPFGVGSRLQRTAVLGAVGALVVALLPALGVAPATAVARELDRQTVTLTAPLEGAQPPGRQLKRAKLEIVHRRAASGVHLTTDGPIELHGAPSGNPDSWVRLGAGRFNGSECQVAAWTDKRVYAVDGATIANVGETFPRPSPLWNCALVALIDASPHPNVIYDAMVGKLKNIYVQPRLKLGGLQVLGKNQKPLKLVRRATQKHTLVLRNAGHLGAKGVVVTGKGSGVKVGRVRVGAVDARSTVSVDVPIRLTGTQRRTKVRLVVQGTGLKKVAKTFAVRRVAAPVRPAAGAWRGGNTFSFRVENGRIVGFRGINMRMTCNQPGQIATSKNVSLGFPKVKVPRHGVVDAVKKYRKGNVWYTAHLRGRIVGSKLVAGRFRYVTAGSCSVSEGFTAKRVGR